MYVNFQVNGRTTCRIILLTDCNDFGKISLVKGDQRNTGYAGMLITYLGIGSHDVGSTPQNRKAGLPSLSKLLVPP